MPKKASGFPKSARVFKDIDFQEAKRSDVKARTKALSISFVCGANKRLGVVAPKASGNAVARNRLKRIAREFFRANKELFPLGDCVVVFYSNAGNKTCSDIRKFIASALEYISKVVEKSR